MLTLITSHSLFYPDLKKYEYNCLSKVRVSVDLVVGPQKYNLDVFSFLYVDFSLYFEFRYERERTRV